MLDTQTAFCDVVADIKNLKPEAQITEHKDGVTIFNQGVFPDLPCESLTLTVVDGHKVVFSYEENMVPTAHADIVSGSCTASAVEQSTPKIKSVLGIV